MICRRNKNGFSIIEALTACIVLSMFVITIGAICTKCLSAINGNIEYETAWSLLDRQLNIVRQNGVAEFSKAGIMQGNFEDYEQYVWNARIEPLEPAGLYKITMKVSWNGGAKSIETVTRLNEDAEIKPLQMEIK